MAKQKKAEEPVVSTQVIAPPVEQAVVPVARGGDTELIAAPPVSAAARAFLDEVKGPRETSRKIPLITIDHHEGKFVVPSGELVDSVVGYPIYWFMTRKYYQKPPRAGEPGKPPDCWSSDMDQPDQSVKKRESEWCSTCPHNQFGSGRDGISKACRTFTWVFLLNGNFGNPPIGVLLVPPSSLKILHGNSFTGGYLSQCVARYGLYEIVKTTFRLEPRGDQVEYSVLVPEMGPALEDVERVKRLTKIRNEFVELMNQMRGVTPEAPMQEESQTEGTDNGQ